MTDLLIHQFDNDENDSETRTATKTIDRPLSLWISHNNRRDLWIMTLLPTLSLDHQFKAENSLFLNHCVWSVAELPRQFMWWMENKSFVKIVELKLTSLFLYPLQNFTFDNIRQPEKCKPMIMIMIAAVVIETITLITLTVNRQCHVEAQRGWLFN